ncbi:MAG TPA: pirin family protein [Polyangiaceae bacterium]|jgi:hypothetical protein|nr:pirin family protein [Polyangiaceae bacterium]
MSIPRTRRDVLGALVGAAGLPLLGCDTAPAPRSSERHETPNAKPPRVAAERALDGRGATVYRVFPNELLSHQDPFVLLDDFRVGEPAGFPTHPHRGFEAFTYMLDGAFHHKDNLGNDSVVSTGGTQRFSSGSGARHSEMPAAPGVNRGLQLWVNLPPDLKRMDPEYAAVHAPDIPEQDLRGVRYRTVVGEGSPVRLRTSVRFLDLSLPARARWQDEVPADHGGLLYVADGHVRVGDVELGPAEGVLPAAGELEIVALADARVALILGSRQHQPIHHHGPFVD